MNAETVINDQALRFSKKIKNWDQEINGIQEFKSELSSALYDYYDKLDKLIFLYQVSKQVDRLYEKHLVGCKHKLTPEQCPVNLYYLKCRFFTEQEIKELNPSFEFTLLRPNINSDLIRENLIKLQDFPQAAKLYQSAVDKLNESRFERNLLDDLRLSLEYVVRQVLDNSKSLENQLEPLGVFLKSTGTSKELINMFRSLTDCYSKYQNSYVKHNALIKEDEVDLMVNLTSAFISFLINKK
jgi:hypothetical protein